MKDISLRDYQQQAKEQIFSQWDSADNILYQMRQFGIRLEQ